MKKHTDAAVAAYNEWRGHEFARGEWGIQAEDATLTEAMREIGRAEEIGAAEREHVAYTVLMTTPATTLTGLLAKAGVVADDFIRGDTGALLEADIAGGDYPMEDRAIASLIRDLEGMGAARLVRPWERMGKQHIPQPEPEASDDFIALLYHQRGAVLKVVNQSAGDSVMDDFTDKGVDVVESLEGGIMNIVAKSKDSLLIQLALMQELYTIDNPNDTNMPGFFATLRRGVENLVR